MYQKTLTMPDLIKPSPQQTIKKSGPCKSSEKKTTKSPVPHKRFEKKVQMHQKNLKALLPRKASTRKTT